MTGFQKIIKYGAIAFGIYLSITIVFVFLGIANGLVGGTKQSVSEIIQNIEDPTLRDISQEYTDIGNLDIHLETVEMTIKTGDIFKIEGLELPEKLEIKQDGNTLKISDEKVSSNPYNKDYHLTLYIPEEQKLNKVDLEIEHICVTIEKITATNLKLDIDRGYCDIDNIIADNLEIDSEYGEIDMYNGETQKLIFDSDSGIEDMTVKVVENAQIDLEYSDTNMTFIGKQEQYQIHATNQFGNTYIAGTELESGSQTLGNGNRKINLKSKSANAHVDFKEMTNENYL